MHMSLSRRTLLAAATGSSLLSACATPSRLQAVDAPAPSGLSPNKPLTKIAFGSCCDQTKPQPVWDSLLREAPDLFIFGGDNVYASQPPFDVANLKAAYATLAQGASFERFRTTVPYVAMWDDHDYGVNDAGVEHAGKQLAKDEFIHFWRLPADDPRRQREGLYCAYQLGQQGQRVQIILLDARWFRSPLKRTDQRDAPGKERYVPDADPAKTMLGNAQWQWLEEQLRQPADLRLIVSGIQVVVDGHGWEGWANFPLERAKLYATIERSRANGVVFLSGDRHIGALYRQTQGLPYPMHEMTSSGLTHAWTEAKEAGPNRLGELVTENHYATVDLDWAARVARLCIKNLANVTVREQKVNLANLQFS